MSDQRCDHRTVRVLVRTIAGLLPVLVGSPAAAQHTLPHNVPHFCSSPTITSVSSGSWSSPSTWSPARVPTVGDAVAIPSSRAVTYDRVSNDALNCISVDGSLTFATGADTRLKVGTLIVMAAGRLEIGRVGAPIAAGVTAEIIIANQLLNTSFDPEQFGTGLIGFGTIRMHGAPRTPTFTRLTAEPLAGAAALETFDSLVGWRPGDRLILPDTRHLKHNEVLAGYQPQWEELSAAQATGQRATLSTPLQYDHRGARDGNGVLEYLPHVGNLTRNVVIRSENPSGTRGHSIFIGRADVDIRYTLFLALGRTTVAALDSTTINSSGQVTHIGTNQIGRYSIHLHHVMGPQTPPSNGRQFTLIGNAIEDGTKWGIAIHNSHYGLVRDNVMYNVNGAELMTEDGSESQNIIDHNFAVRSFGTGGRQGNGREGTGFYFRGPNNYVRNNVAANILSDANDAAYGFKYFHEYLGNIRVPNFPGADTTVAGQYTTRDGNAMPVLEFTDNEVYGATEAGLTYWWVGTFGNGYPRANVGTSVFKNLRIWHVHNRGIFNYEGQNIMFDGLVIRGDYTDVSACCGTGIDMADYYHKVFDLKNSDIQGMKIGILPTTDVDNGTVLRITDTTLRNQVNVVFKTLWTSGYRADKLRPRVTELKNVRFQVPTTSVTGLTKQAIKMEYSGGPIRHLMHLDEVRVYDYNGAPGDSFHVFYTQADPSFIVPQTMLNSDGTPSLVGSPVAGRTNSQVFTTYGIAIGGRPATCATTRPMIQGFVCTGVPPYVPPSVVPPSSAPSAPSGLRITSN